MRITALRVENFKRLRDVEVAPGGRALIIIGGRNRQGKSSLLDALTAAFGGKGAAPTEAVRKGERFAEISVELDGGTLNVIRRINEDGRHTLEVRDGNLDRVKSPQKVLDQIVGARFLDPLQFVNADAKRQRELLLQVADIKLDLDEWARERERRYDKRTEIGRDERRLAAELQGLGDAVEVPPLVSVTETAEDLETLRAGAQKFDDESRRLAEMRVESEQIDAEIEEIEAKLAKLRARADDMVARGKAQAGLVAKLEAEVDLRAIDTLRESLANAERKNQAHARAVAQNERRAEAVEAHAKAEAGYKELSTAIEAMDADKAAALAEAKMPIDGLGVDDDGVTFGGVPFEQASSAEQIQTSLSIAAALSPELLDIWIKDGSLCDGESLDTIRGFAETNGLTVWLERVGDGDDDAIIIEDGMIAPARPRMDLVP